MKSVMVFRLVLRRRHGNDGYAGRLKTKIRVFCAVSPQ